MSSGITIGTIRKWRPESLEDAAGTIRIHRDKLTELDDDLDGCKPPSSWQGQAADAARGTHDKIAEAGRDLTAEVAAVRAATIDAADAVTSLRNSLTETEDLARAKGFSVGDDGSITETGEETDMPEAERETLKAELADRVGELERRAKSIDDQLAKVLRDASKDEIDGDGSLANAAQQGAEAGGLSVTKPPEKGDPGANAAWWSSLSSDERQSVLQNHPEWVGNRNGIPATVRDEANRTLLDREEKRLQDIINEQTGRAPSPEVLEAREKLKSIESIRKTLQEGDDKQLLMFDTSAEQAQAAVSDGNVDTADKVAVLTPGMNTTVHDSLAEKDDRMQDLRSDAENASGEKVATVTWIGYDKHPGLLEENSNDLAEQTGDDLRHFYEGINASRVEDPELTALGHSYGAVTTGRALEHEGIGVDNAVLFGSPGPATSDVSNLEVPEDSVYTVKAEQDYVDDAGSMFTSERGGELDGATHLSGEDSEEGAATTGHSDYLTEGNTSQHNISSVVAGEEDEVIHEGDRN
ncbi:Alpha/beta hydrolase [Actinopolyspora alba]|uniref:Alpha/beta hydrolase n=1 Tax=Actinopolyspora alba TaxID=673379 RepID=A0A1I2BXF8_9ACTN|nr:alpha/beta hydrolase [Actinopolyspora alba]SFE60876.1 Alpha/beta hydrolase [Actinopolyspora alba]